MTPPLRVLFALLALTACVDPRLNADLSIGPNGTTIQPTFSTGIDGGGTITISP